MPDYLHRTTFALLHSVASADLPEAESNYILNPVLPDAPSKYWEVSGNDVKLMDAAARTKVDVDEKEIQDTAEVDALDNVIVRALLDEINVLKTNAGIPNTTFDEMKDAEKAKLGN